MVRDSAAAPQTVQISVMASIKGPPSWFFYSMQEVLYRKTDNKNFAGAGNLLPRGRI